MTSTVTTATISTIATVALATSLSLIATITLLTFLFQKEILAVSDSPRAQVLNRVLNIAIAPLSVIFVMSVLIKVLEVIG